MCKVLEESSYSSLEVWKGFLEEMITKRALGCLASLSVQSWERVFQLDRQRWPKYRCEGMISVLKMRERHSFMNDRFWLCSPCYAQARFSCPDFQSAAGIIGMFNHTRPQGKCLRNSTDATVVLLIERDRDRYRKWLVRREIVLSGCGR